MLTHSVLLEVGVLGWAVLDDLCSSALEGRTGSWGRKPWLSALVTGEV